MGAWATHFLGRMPARPCRQRDHWRRTAAILPRASSRRPTARIPITQRRVRPAEHSPNGLGRPVPEAPRNDERDLMLAFREQVQEQRGQGLHRSSTTTTLQPDEERRPQGLRPEAEDQPTPVPSMARTASARAACSPAASSNTACASSKCRPAAGTCTTTSMTPWPGHGRRHRPGASHALLEDLASRACSSRTLVVLGSEFGRTPDINENGGRDHYPKVFTTVFAGGGVKGGYVHGASDPEGREVADKQSHSAGLPLHHRLRHGPASGRSGHVPSNRPFTGRRQGQASRRHLRW